MANYLKRRNLSVRYRFLVFLAVLITLIIFLVYRPMETFSEVQRNPYISSLLFGERRYGLYHEKGEFKRFVELTKREVSGTTRVGGIGLTYKYPNTMYMTCPNQSVYSVRESDIYQNTYVVINIHAKDLNGRRRPSGGDFWRVLISQRERNASTVATIIDHHNGSYTAHAFISWSGYSQIQVTLVHPSDATHYLLHNYTHLPDRSGFVGIFRQGETVEKTKCVVQHEGSWSKKCEYFHPTGLYSTRLLCDAPPTLPCNSLVMLPRSDETNAYNLPMVAEDKTYLFADKRRYQPVKNGPETLFVIDSITKPRLPVLPKCGPGLPEPLVDGYWLEGHYHSMVCDNSKQYTNEDIQHCLSNTHLLLLGDSQLRLLFSHLRIKLGIPAKINKYTHSMHLHKKEINFNVTFQFHPLFRHPEEGMSLVEDHRYEAEILDNLDTSENCNLVIVLGPWAHYALWTAPAYRERLEFLSDAVDRIFQRCPNSKVIMKGPQPSKTNSTFFDFICKNMMYEQRKIFGGHGLSYLNVWDMFDAAYWLEDPHPSDSDSILGDVLHLLHSYICPK